MAFFCWGGRARAYNWCSRYEPRVSWPAMSTRITSFLSAGLTAGILLASTSDALAHIQIAYPAQRTASQKTGPCGAAGSTRGDTVTVLQPGATITVQWDETIDHPGHYRISFDVDGDDDFVDPATMDELNSNAAVLVDGIEDLSGGIPRRYEQTITLPNVECTSCTLQLIQVMGEKEPYGNGDDLYYQCADLVLTNNPQDLPDAGGGSGADAGTGNPPGNDDGGCQAAGTGSLGTLGMMVLALAALALPRRRRLRA